ncbi:MAG: diaminopimelate epimerase [Clostridia bacterium]|nr:diaminopimelate epimerase [Clostridia bacterium]
MKIKFTKMHGCGNDYVYINGFEERIDAKLKPDFVRKVSDRHFGIGSDGVIFINPSSIADFEMEMWNADGTRAEMCGNGIRCVAKYVYDNKLTTKEEMTIESMGKIKYITVFSENGKAQKVTVDMGEPILIASQIPVVAENTKVINDKIMVDNDEYRMTCVSMGNPHAVVFLDPDTLKIEEIGPKFENHARFPNRTNTEFVKILDKQNVKMRVWERGTGETLACGTGCCATVVACILNGLTDSIVNVHVIGGEIVVQWSAVDNHVYMTGPATMVFEGEIDY